MNLKAEYVSHATLWPNCKQVMRPFPNSVGDYLEYEVRGILKCKNHKQKNEYFVRWQRSHENKTTSIATRNMLNAKKLWSIFQETKFNSSNKHKHIFQSFLVGERC